MLIHEAVEDYLESIKITKKEKTLAAYQIALKYFLENCTKRMIHELDRKDLQQFSFYLKSKKKLSPRTVHNKYNSVVIFLKSQGMEKIIHKQDWPKFVEEEPQVYSREQLDIFFSFCNPYEKVVFKTFLLTGLREQELTHLDQDDINFDTNVISVRYKPEYGYSPKTYKSREIPLHSELRTLLTTPFPDWREGIVSNSNLLFPSSEGLPRTDFLSVCKSVAKRAGLNPEDFWLHRFRSTFATTCLRSGIDLKTVQEWLGHLSLSSTMRYLAPQRGKEALERMNKVNF